MSWMILAGLIAWLIRKRLSTLSALAALWLAWSGVRVFVGPNPFPNETIDWVATLHLGAASALAWLVVLWSGVEVVKPNRLLLWIQTVSVVNALLMVAEWFFGSPGGLFLNESMAGCFSAACLPLFFGQRRVPGFSVILLPLSVFLAGQSQPIALLFVILGWALLRSRCYLGVFIATVASVAIGHWITGHELLNSMGRFEVWAITRDFWLTHVNPWIGEGLGSFYYVGPWLTSKRLNMGWLYLHSDWLQILFETGIPGLALTLALFIEMLWRTRKKVALQTAVIAYGAFGIANFPLRNPISAFLGMALIQIVYAATAKAPEETSTPHPHCPA